MVDYDKLARSVSVQLEKDLSRFVGDLRNGESTSIQGVHVQSHTLAKLKLPHPVSTLGDELMKELLVPTMSDIQLKVGGEVFLCHKEVLTNRCEYFAAMLRHNWAEAISAEVILENIQPEEMVCLLCFVYGGSIQMPTFCTLSVVAHVADMYCMTQLGDAVKLHIISKLCHSFHKPCKVCSNNFAEALQICSVFGKSPTLSIILSWYSFNFDTFWRTKGYYTLPSSLRKKCLSAVKSSVNVSNVIDIVIKVDQLLGSITRVKWTMPVVANASELMNHCSSFIVSNISSLVENRTIMKLFEGLGFKSNIVDRILMEIIDGTTTSNACDIYLAASRLYDLSVTDLWDESIVKLLTDLKKKVWSILVSNHFAVIHADSWCKLNESDKEAITAQSLCGGNPNRKLSKKPVLSSSMNIKPPTPAVLKRVPMKVLSRKASSRNTATVPEQSRNESLTKGMSDRSASHSFESKQAPERQAIISTVELLSGAPIDEVSVISYYQPVIERCGQNESILR